MAGEPWQPPVSVMDGSRGSVDGNNQGLKPRLLKVADIRRGKAPAVGAQEGMDPQVPGPAQGREQGGIKQGFAAGEAEVANALIFENLKPPEKSRRIGHHPCLRRHRWKAAKAATGIAGVGDGNLAKTRSPLQHQTQEFLAGHGQRLASATGVC